MQTTQAKVEKLEDEKADLLLAARTNQERANQDLATIAQLERALDLAQAAAGTHPTTGGKRQKIRDPEVFTGKREEYNSFRSKMITKLNGDAHLFDDEQHKLQYIVSFLKDHAYKIVKPYVKDDKVDLETVAEIWEVLDAAYDDPDRKGTAERELRKLRQANREFSAYLADFQHIMSELQWNVPAKCVTL